MRASSIQHISFIALLVIVTLSFLGMIRDFYQPLFWAAVLAVLFHRLQEKSLHWLRGRSSLAAVLSMLIILLLVILPLFLVAAAVTSEAVGIYERLSQGKMDFKDVIQYVERTVPAIGEYLDRFGIDLQKIQQRFSEGALAASRFLASQMVNIGQLTAQFLVKFFLMLYLLFFFLRDGHRITRILVRALPLGDMRERRLFGNFAEVSRATVKGSLIVGVVQGAIGGLLFWVLGVGAPVFWGVIMTILSLLPAVGSALVWAPAAIILIAKGSTARGIILIIAGVLVIGLVDNILRPILVGRSTRMPDFLVLIATLGGLTVFGISGFVIGPMIAALFLTVWDIFSQEYSTSELEEKKITLPGEPRENVPPP